MQSIQSSKCNGTKFKILGMLIANAQKKTKNTVHINIIFHKLPLLPSLKYIVV